MLAWVAMAALIYAIDFGLVSPLFLPEDPCYYHTHLAPRWVELLYLDPDSNRHPDGSRLHFGAIVILAAFLARASTHRRVVEPAVTEST